MTLSHLAFVFPGQGSQKIGLLSELASQHALVTETFSEASSVLGYDMWDLVQNGTQEDINMRSEEHTSELQSREKLVCRLLLEKKNQICFLVSTVTSKS